MTLDNGSHIYLPTRTDVSSVSSLRRFVQNAHASSTSVKPKKREANAANKTKKRTASTGVKERKPHRPPYFRVPPQAPLILPTICTGNSDDEDPPLLVTTRVMIQMRNRSAKQIPLAHAIVRGPISRPLHSRGVNLLPVTLLFRVSP